MGKNRDRLSIVAAILEATPSNSSKTRIIVEANLSFNLLEKYLNKTVEAGLVEYNDYKYNLTDYGREFLRQYKLFEVRYTQARESLESLILEREKLRKVIDCKELSH